MRIKEYRISRYGPLKESGRIHPGSFTLFCGPNENGKTLTIDAILKFLFGKSVKKFNKIHRVDEEPDGYIILQDKDNQDIKLPEKGDLEDLTGISADEARNIFIIRDSDLAIHEESTHYRNITDRLTGMRTKEIDEIVGRLLDSARLTPSGLFTNREDKIRDRWNQAQKLLENIERKKKDIHIEEVDIKEKELADISESMRKLDQKIEQYSLAEKRIKLEKGETALTEIRKSRHGLEKLAVFTEEEEQKWREYEHDIEREISRKNKLEKDLEQESGSLNSLEEKALKYNQEFEQLDRIRSRIDQEIKPDLRNYENKASEIKAKEGKDRFFTWISLFSIVVAVLSSAGIILNAGDYLFIPVFAVSFLTASLAGFQKYQLIRNRARQKGMLEKIRLNLAQYTIHGKTIADLSAAVQEFDNRWSLNKKQKEDAEKKWMMKQNTVRNLKDKELPQIQQNIRNAEEKIREIKEKSGVNTLSEYRSMLKERESRHNSIETQKDVLSTLFQKNYDRLEDNIRDWEQDIRRLEPCRDQARNIEYRDEEHEKLKFLKEEFEEKKENLENHFRNFQKQLREIENEANQILQRESEYLPCKTSVDLKEIEKQIQNFKDSLEKRAETVKKAQEIFTDIKGEEEEKVTELFGKESAVSLRFEQITGGRYREVHFDPERKKVIVKDSREQILEADQLSGGAYDQLYLSVRLGLGESLLKEQKGFFILDDPFIKADAERLNEQMIILKDIASSGWQVLYFSAKDEVRQALAGDIKKGTVDLISLPGLQ